MARHLQSVVNDATPVSAPANTDDIATFSSGNVFEDLGFANPAEAKLKADLVISIKQEIERRRLSQVEAGRLMGLSQPDVSKMLRGRVSGLSLERLIAFTRALGSDVEITVRRSEPVRAGRINLRVLETV